MPITAIDAIEAIAKVIGIGSVCGGSGPVLIVGCCVVEGVGEDEGDGVAVGKGVGV